MMRRVLYFLLVFTTAALPGAATSATDDIRHFYVRFTTTSDWSRWSLDGAAMLARIIQSDGDDSSGIFVDGGIQATLRQPIDPRREIFGFYEVFVDSPPGSLNFSLYKGDLGESRIEIFAKRPKEGDTPDFQISNTGKVPGDPENLLAATIPDDLASRFESLALPVSNYERRVLAFYYPWYGNPKGASHRWSHWSATAPNHAARHTPVLGWYDSNDTRVLKTHIAWAKEAGINGFIVSWWGIDSFEDQALPAIMKAAEATHFKISIYLERGDTPEDVARDIEYLASHYGTSKAFLMQDGAPVIFVYSRVLEKMDTSEKWQAVRDALKEKATSVFLVGDTFSAGLATSFDGLHTYNPVSQPVDQMGAGYRAVRLGTRIAGRLFAATVVPGYDDTNVRKPGMVVERDDGALYSKFWQAAIDTNPDWILVTSFNEWHEGSEIEPSKELADRYLRLTRALSRSFK